jgi:hypothetical protein
MPGMSLVQAAGLAHVGSRTSEDGNRTAIGLPMSEFDVSPRQSVDDHSFGKGTFLRRQLPFLAMLTLAIAGVAYTNFSHKPLVGYWEFLAVAMCVVCVVTEWSELDDRQTRFRLMWTQALHWVAVLVTMNIMLLSGVQQLLPAQATSLVLLMLLALGSFLVGLNLMSLPISFLGLAMALAVPAISWIKQSALLLVLAMVFLIGIGMTFWSRWGGAPRSERQTRPYSDEPKGGTGNSTGAHQEDGVE